MPEEIIKFFSLSYWNVIGNIFTAIGILSTIFMIIRFFHENGLKEWKCNVSIEDYPANYDIESNFKDARCSKVWTNPPSDYDVIIVFQPVDCIIRKLEVIRLDTNGLKIDTLENFRNITPEEAICFRTERSECSPRYKIRWYSDYGEYAEYSFAENCRNGITRITGRTYHTTPVSFLRKAFGLR